MANYLKKILKKILYEKLEFPKYSYQNIHTNIKIRSYHSGEFNKLHNYFCSKDKHLNFNTEITRFRNYNNYKFAEIALNNNPEDSFLSAGISYGTSLKIITHLLDKKANNNNYYIMDNYKNLGRKNYNTDIQNVKNDLVNIKNFNLIFLEKLLSKKNLDEINDKFSFIHLNTTNFETEFECLPKVIEKLACNGILIIDYYGWSDTQQAAYDEYIKKNNNLFSYISPSLQLIIIKFK